jgi:L-fucose mutarotase/ribose pyranase (RbsD/FucU family)
VLSTSCASTASARRASLSPPRQAARCPLAAIERFTFYERAREAFATVATGETRLYGNILLRKGVIRPV